MPTSYFLAWLGASDPVVRFSLTISLTNLTETSKRCRRMMRIARLNMRHHALKKRQRMRFSHDDPPCLFENNEARIKTKTNPEADQTQNALSAALRDHLVKPLEKLGHAFVQPNAGDVHLLNKDFQVGREGWKQLFKTRGENICSNQE